MLIVRRHRRTARRAFTLMEVLIVIAILLALVGIVAGFFLNVGEQADVDVQRIQIRLIDDAMSQFRLHMKRYPTEDEGLAALWNKTMLEEEEDEARWRGPYLEEPIERDKWGSEFVYYSPSQLLQTDNEKTYDIISLGPDKEEETEDDITNHDHRRGEDGEFGDAEDFTFDDDASDGF